jgi:hypothetical protein
MTGRLSRYPVGWCLFLLALLWVPASTWALAGSDLPTVMIPDVLVYSDPDSRDALAGGVLVVDKRRQLTIRYVFDSEWRETQRWVCSTGKTAGSKEVEGDQKTPEGLYFITRHVDQRYLSETYGSRALTLDYPNLYDRRLGRTGSNIWLHGTNKVLRERDSNGCVVLENTDIDEVARQIKIQRTPVIIVDQLNWWPQKEASQMAATLLEMIRQWQDTMLRGSYDKFRQWYAPEAAPSQQWWKNWTRLRLSYAIDDTALRSEIGDVAIYRPDGVIVLLFDHFLHAGEQRIPAGRRKLFIKPETKGFSIIGDTYHSVTGDAELQKGQEPLFAAWHRLWQTRQGNPFTARESRLGELSITLRVAYHGSTMRPSSKPLCSDPETRQ